MNDTTKLSPAAQAVKNAVLALYQEGQVRDSAWLLERPMVAAALRAAADQITDSSPEWLGSEGVVWSQQKLRFVAAELDGGAR
jgi:hypothetical protein